MDIRNGIDKLDKRLNKMYLKIDVLKKTLPVEIIRNSRKLPVQNLSNASVNDFLDFGQENVADFDNSINSLRGCWFFGTGHVVSFMNSI